ncbi:MAG: PD-(D/E)XK nuclease family protein [Caldilineaceae bacterium]|nr:PD-(D/E)XK nuclease family protein [Caldilineaceae bacterium]
MSETHDIPPAVPLLPPTFSFSQSSLQAYEECARRFWLAYVRQLPWPAVEASPVQEYEQLMRMGAAFHRQIERAEIGLDDALLSQSLEPPLDGWFESYLRHRPADLPTDFVEIEHVLSIPFIDPAGAYRLVAKYDLIAGDHDGRVVIIDWKTSRRRTDPATLRHRLQSLVYPFVLVEASGGLPWGSIAPERVEMWYWFTAAPMQPVIFRYDAAQHAANHARLQTILKSILAGAVENDFPKVLDTEQNRRRLCSYCVYRSRCNRGAAAGDLDELADAEEFFAVDIAASLEFRLDDVEELAF